MEKPGRRQSWGLKKKVGIALGSLILVAAGVGGFVNQAKADPHAMFYTAIGQQQLFFNILAALDQADYVEPAEGDDRFSREGLLDKRDETGFTQYSNDALDATKTDLAAVVTRNVTLEGADLWTAYQMHAYSLEAARRNYTDELVRVFCERALGRVGCSTEAGPAQQQDEAFVTSAQKEAAEVAIGVNAALNSGTAGDQALRQKVADQTDPDAPDYILPYDSAIAAQRAAAQGNELAESAIERLTASAQVSDRVNPSIFDYLTKDPETGEVKLVDDAPPGEFFHKLAQLADAQGNMLSSAIAAQEKVVQQKAVEIENGSKADTEKVATIGNSPVNATGLATSGGGGAGGTYYKTISREVTTPASAKVAMMGELAGTLSREVTDLKYANTEVGDTPGTQQLVDRGSVAGIRSDQAESQGKVAGIFDIISGLYQGIYDFYDKPKSELSPNVSAVDPKLEDGSRAALAALTNDTFRRGDTANTSCGFCVNLDDPSFWQSILNSLGSIFCSLFPDWCPNP